MSAPIEGPGHFIAAGLRLEAHDIAEGRGPWLGVTYTCRSCERPTLSLQTDGWCATCNDGSTSAMPPDPANVRSLHADAAATLRRLSEDRGISAEFRAVLLGDADYHERLAHA